MAKSVRIDKYLWAVRVYKTRTLATEACKKGKVSVDDMPAKPSRAVTTGDVIQVKKLPVVYSYRVIDPIEKRVGAKIVEDYVENITPEEELNKLELQDDFDRNQRTQMLFQPCIVAVDPTVLGKQ